MRKTGKQRLFGPCPKALSRSLLTFIVCLAAPACSERSGKRHVDTDAATDSAIRDSSTADALDTRTSDDAPVIVEFRANRNVLTEGDTVTFIVVATDPDGIADLIGGTLMSEDRTATYGSFATSGEEGAYSLELSWDAIHLVSPIEFEAPTKRRFVAEFFDASANRAQRSIDIELTCGCALDSCNPACDGKCNQVRCQGVCRSPIFDSAQHCGSCGNACSESQTCNAGQCACPNNEQVCGGTCIDVSNDDANCGTCNNVCKRSCLSGACTCDNVTYSPFNNPHCGATQADCLYDETDNVGGAACHDLSDPVLSSGKQGELQMLLDGQAVPVCSIPFASSGDRTLQIDAFCKTFVTGSTGQADWSYVDLTTRYASDHLAIDVDCTSTNGSYEPFSEECTYTIEQVTGFCDTGFDITCL